MNELFIENDTNLEKTASHGMVLLDKDSTQWVRVIIKEFINDYPALQNMIAGINWKKKDFNRGFAIGTLMLNNGMHVPLIVQNFKCFPFDVLIAGEGIFIPLTNDTIAELFTNPSPFQGVVNATPKSNLNMFNDGNPNFSPVGNIKGTNLPEGSSVRDAVKLASFIDRIETVDKDSIKMIFTELKNSPELLNYFEQHNTTPVLEKLASKSYTSVENEIDSYLRTLPIDRQYSYEDEDGNKFLKQANSKIDYTWETNITDVENTFETLTAEDATKIGSIQNFEDTSKLPEIGDNGYLFINGVKTPTFEVTDMYIPTQENEKIATLSYYNNTGNLVLLNDKRWIDSIDSIKLANVNTAFIFEGDEPQMGDWGIFVIPESNLSTRPFRVEGIIKEAGENLVYDVETHSGLTPMTYKFSKIEKNNFISGEGKYATYVPKNAVYIKLGTKLDDSTEIHTLVKKASINSYINTNVTAVIEGYSTFEKVSYLLTKEVKDITPVPYLTNSFYVPEDVDFKIAFRVKTAEQAFNTTNIVGKDPAGLYFLKGDTIEKFASNHKVSSLTKDETLWSLIQLGASKEDLTKVASLVPGDYYVVANKLEAPIKVTDFEKLITNEYEKIASDLTNLNLLLVKEAAVINSEISVDAMLSLGLMKKFNVMEYLNLIPDYERVMSELARLLVASRLNTTQIPDVPIKVAMESLAAVVSILKQLQASITN